MPSSFDIPIEGVRFGHAEDERVQTGTTACLFDEPAVCAVHIMGAAPGTRETELLDPAHTVSSVDAIVLSGGSAYGLDAAGGVQGWLKEHDRGIELAPVRIPIVPCAILFDLRNEGDKNWGRFSPYQALGYEAAVNATTSVHLGRVGAAFGARTATTPGGFGLVSQATPAGGTLIAAAAVNAAGSPLIGDTDHFWAAPFEEGSEFGGRGMPHPFPDDARIIRTKAGQRVAGANTTLGLIVTDIDLTPAQAKRIAIASHDGFARALYPVHTPADGDLIFVASTGRIRCDDDALMDTGILAGNAIARAIAVGVHAAMETIDA